MGSDAQAKSPKAIQPEDRRGIFWRVFWLLVLLGSVAGAYYVGRDGWAAIGKVTVVALTAAVLLVLLFAICQHLFGLLDKVLDWLHPAWPWFRWPRAVVWLVMAVCTAGVIALLGLNGWVDWVASLGPADGDGIVATVFAWVWGSGESLLSPFFAAPESAQGRSWSLRWIHPLALLAGVGAAVHRNGTAVRIARLDTHRRDKAVAPPTTDVPPNHHEVRTRKRIIVFCDGTSNSAKAKNEEIEAPTNVHRLYTMVSRFDQNDLPQIPIYDPGVGTNTSRQAILAQRLASIAETLSAKRIATQTKRYSKFREIWELATGAGLLENVEQGYREIVRLYEPGDEIWLFGFSRGAYTVRCIAGVIGRCGLLKPEHIRFVPDVLLLYRRRPAYAGSGLVAPEYVYPDVKIRFMGLWDTVASLGLPLWGWWFRVGALWRNQSLDNNPAGICQHVYQALSIDESRSQFMPTLAEPPEKPNPDQRIEQVWFRGGHAEVGGGYVEHELADIALEWMVGKAKACGLVIDDKVATDIFTCHAAPPLPTPRDFRPLAPIKTALMRNPSWATFGTWPRWHPAERPGSEPAEIVALYGSLADQVWIRAQAAMPIRRDAERDPLRATYVMDQRAAADAFVFLEPGESAVVTVQANCIWNRSGVVMERDASYAIEYVDGLWTDKEGVSVDIDGDKLGFDLVRRIWAYARRDCGARYVELIGHVAHPRLWPTFEFGSIKLLRYFMYRDPAPLHLSLIRLGRVVKAHGHAVVHVKGASGIFYAFANDLWATYANNSGAVRIRIRRLTEAEQKAVETDKTAWDRQFFISRRGEVFDGQRYREDLSLPEDKRCFDRERWGREET